MLDFKNGYLRILSPAQWVSPGVMWSPFAKRFNNCFPPICLPSHYSLFLGARHFEIWHYRRRFGDRVLTSSSPSRESDRGTKWRSLDHRGKLSTTMSYRHSISTAPLHHSKSDSKISSSLPWIAFAVIHFSSSSLLLFHCYYYPWDSSLC